MFTPREYQERRLDVLHATIEDVRLGTLITGADPDGGPSLAGSHLPFLLDRTRGAQGTLIGHFDRRNPQWRALARGDEALVVFLGADANVPAGCYGTRPRVPTWLYSAVHVYGRPVLVEDRDAIHAMVVALSVVMEPAGSAWSPDGEGVERYVDRLVAGVIGFKIPIARMEGQVRLAQRNGPDDWRRVHEALGGGDPRARRVADAMAAFRARQADADAGGAAAENGEARGA